MRVPAIPVQCIYTHARTYLQTHTHAHTHTRTRTHTHTYNYIHRCIDAHADTSNIHRNKTPLLVRCIVVQCVAVCRSECVAVHCSMSQGVSVCSRLRCSVLKHDAALQCVAVCRSASQCVAARWLPAMSTRGTSFFSPGSKRTADPASQISQKSAP